MSRALQGLNSILGVTPKGPTTHWSSHDKSEGIKLSQDKLYAKSTSWWHFGGICTNKPIPTTWSMFYYEIKILCGGEIIIGLATPGRWMDLLPGSSLFGYNNNDGRLRTYGPSFTRKDVFGCGLLGTDLFYTKNQNFHFIGIQ